jgi:histidine triad (HIT) family protein
MTSVSCEFCRLAAREKPCHIIYENNLVLSFLDSSPVNPGHVLAIPKAHVPSFHELDPESYNSLMSAVRTISRAMHTSLKPAKVGVLIAGFDVDHTHVHIIPMNSKADVATKRVFENIWPTVSDDELQMTAKLLISALSTDA